MTHLFVSFTERGYQKLQLLRDHLYARTVAACIVRALKEMPPESARDCKHADAEAAAWAKINELMSGYPTKTAFAEAIGMTLPGLSKAMERRALTPAILNGLRKGLQVTLALDLPKPRRANHRIVCSMSKADLALLSRWEAVTGASRGATFEAAVIAAAATLPRGRVSEARVEAVRRLRDFRMLADRYETQIELAKAMQIYPERVSRILTGKSPIGDVLAKRMAALLSRTRPGKGARGSQ